MASVSTSKGVEGRSAAWVIFLSAGALAIVGYLTILPEGLMPFAYPAIGLGSFIAMVVGIRRNRPERAHIFWILAAGLFSWVVADVVFQMYELVWHIEAPNPWVADPIYLLGIILWVIPIWILALGRRRWRESTAWIDTAVAFVALAMIEWVVVIHPYLSQSSDPFLSQVTSAAHPIADIFLLAAMARLIVTPGARTAAFPMLSIAFLGLLVSDSIHAINALHGTPDGGLIDAGWLGTYVLLGSAVLHPSIRQLAHRVSETVEPHSNYWVLGLPLLIAPPVYAWTMTRTSDDHLTLPVLVGSWLLTVLVLVRLNAVVRRLSEAQAQRRALLRKTLEASEDERLYLATMIHDGPIQGLTTMLLKLDAASDPTVHPGRGSAPNDMRESVAAEIVRLRRLMKSLRPGALIERGLEGAIRDHLGEITVGHDVDYQLDVELTHRFIPELETVIYRAVQAAVSGALARTDVTRLSVRLRDVGTAVDLVVEDNHAGDEAIDFAALRERISMFEGTLDVGGVPGEGSCVHVVIPTGIAA